MLHRVRSHPLLPVWTLLSLLLFCWCCLLFPSPSSHCLPCASLPSVPPICSAFIVEEQKVVKAVLKSAAAAKPAAKKDDKAKKSSKGGKKSRK